MLVLSAVLFAVTAPFGAIPLGRVNGFIPATEAMLILNGLITAALLFGQFASLPSPAVLVLATGYLFDAQLTLGHALSFPGVFDEEGLFKAPQLTPWLYVLWHMSVPGIILAYVAVDVICGDRLLIAPRAATAWAMLVGLGGGALAVAAMAWVVDALPPLLEGSSRYARTGPGGVRIG
ncbi:MAG: MASE4 domain-containing protein, partial [Rhodospirillales bacterium]|nr:MASE4 domain-containing protein [Rhodospirillales bacterium]